MLIYTRHLAFAPVRPGMLVQKQAIRGTQQCSVSPHAGGVVSELCVVAANELPDEKPGGSYQPCELVPILTGYEEPVLMLLQPGQLVEPGNALVSAGDGTLRRGSNAAPHEVVGHAQSGVTGPHSLPKLIWVMLRKERTRL